MKEKYIIILDCILLLNFSGCGLEPTAPDHGFSFPPAIPQKFLEAKCEFPAPIVGYRAAIGWLTVLHDYRTKEESKVMVDYLRLHSIRNGFDTIIASDEYDSNQADGGYWGFCPDGQFHDDCMNPSNWYANELGKITDFEFENGKLVIWPGRRPGVIWHVWNSQWPRAVVQQGSQCWMEASIEIQGPALVQGGIDYWVNEYSLDSENKEAGYSDWVLPNENKVLAVCSATTSSKYKRSQELVTNPKAKIRQESLTIKKHKKKLIFNQIQRT